jgi:hypothetical protein
MGRGPQRTGTPSAAAAAAAPTTIAKVLAHPAPASSAGGNAETGGAGEGEQQAAARANCADATIAFDRALAAVRANFSRSLPRFLSAMCSLAVRFVLA